jgi:hypothetical protein
MKTIKELYTLPLVCLFLIFIKCEKEQVLKFSDRQIDTNFLISGIIERSDLYREFSYNDKKKLVRIDYYTNDSLYNCDTFKYNSEGKLYKKTIWDGYAETYEYDKSGRYTKRKVYNRSGELSEVTEFLYDSIGRIEKGVRSYPNYDHVTTYLLYYDSNGNVIKVEEGSFIIIEYEYDNKKNPRFNWGLPNEIVQYNNPVKYNVDNPLSCSIPPNYIYEYEYNAHGYPVTEYRTHVYGDFVDTICYEYLE